MASHFDQWEKDPFFSAAEEVQESADRMESTYRTWIHAMKDTSNMWNSEELRRDLRTALGTAKWQLEEFERAVSSSYSNSSADDAKDRHREFIIAIGSQISKVESSLNESAVSEGKPPVPWVRLDEGECNELALFLSGPLASGNKTSAKIHVSTPLETDKQSSPMKNSRHSVEQGLLEAREEKLPGHRRTASASADIGAWKIAVADELFPQISSNGQPEVPPRRVPSFSGFLTTMETASKLKWSKNGYRKLKLTDRHQEVDNTLSQSQQLTRSINACNERSKSCLDGCDDCYDKQLYVWYGAIQRQLQRSQYQMQYSRPVQVIFWIVLLFCLLVLFALRAI
uniref:Syntaxin 6/10/61 N-terminal domain-containing protein n=3 Tax=Davidia involucrata TaxID=16924 RepID=A0A5B7A0N4_DAVIN